MKLHELKQKRNTIAADMRALHDKIGENTWTDDQRSEWNKAKSELDGLDAQIVREEELLRQDQSYVDENEQEQSDTTSENQDDQRCALAFDKFLRYGQAEMSAEERQVLRAATRAGAEVLKC